MGLIYDSPDLAALTLAGLAAEESEGPGALEVRMLEYLDGPEQRNGTPFLELVSHIYGMQITRPADQTAYVQP